MSTEKKYKKIAILQSNYIPWKGYFDIIGLVDEFILFDDMQYTKNDWRNRNKIKTPQGLKWLSIPVETSGRLTNTRLIRETKIIDANWNKKHWNTLLLNYSKAEYFNEFKSFFEELYLNCHEEFLSKINYRFIKNICDLLEIKTKLSWSMDYILPEGKTEKLISLCIQAGADYYLSGPSAKDYINENLFKEAGIQLEFMDYSGYPEYRQLFPPFEHGVSIIDLIFNEGLEAKKYMKCFWNRNS